MEFSAVPEAEANRQIEGNGLFDFIGAAETVRAGIRCAEAGMVLGTARVVAQGGAPIAQPTPLFPRLELPEDEEAAA